jgi:hypothetical protein
MKDTYPESSDSTLLASSAISDAAAFLPFSKSINVNFPVAAD